MTVWALVLAGGNGTRFGGPKQFADLAGRPILSWSIDSARQACDGVVLVLPPGCEVETEWNVDAIVVGGASRSQSVRNGLVAVPDAAEIIAVHDAARPLARPGLWEAVITEIRSGADAAVPAAPVTDTVKEVASDGRLITLDRSRLVAVQTPQAFRASALRAAHTAGIDATDDAALVEAAGGLVRLVPGPADNIKVTEPFDLLVAGALIGAPS